MGTWHRASAVLTLMAMTAGAFVSSTAVAASAKRCAPKISPPDDLTEVDLSEYEMAPLLRVTNAATEAKPLTIEFAHDASAMAADDLSQNSRFFKLAVIATGRTSHQLNIRADWATPSISNLDLYLYRGSYITGSSAFNNPALDAVHNQLDPQNGGMGYEWIEDFEVFPCQGFVLESFANWTAGEDVTLQVWLEK